MIADNYTGRRTADKARKDLLVVFQELGLKITSENKYQIVSFLDITLILRDGKLSSYRKLNNNLLYVDSRSSLAKSTKLHHPLINALFHFHLTMQQFFEACKPYYKAQEQSNYNVRLL